MSNSLSKVHPELISEWSDKNYPLTADICGILPDVSPTTVEAVLSKMVKDGQIKKNGQSRMTRYIKA